MSFNPVALAQNAQAVLLARYAFRNAESLGPRVRVWGKVIANVQGRLIVGDRARFGARTFPLEIAVGREGLLEIGERAYINYGGSIAAMKHIRIGARVMIGPHSMIIDNEFHRLEPDRRLEAPESRPIVIEDNAWLGARVIVLPGVTIGRDSVIGAGSVVTKDIPPGVIAAGSPAKVIRSIEDAVALQAARANPSSLG